MTAYNDTYTAGAPAPGVVNPIQVGQNEQAANQHDEMVSAQQEADTADTSLFGASFRQSTNSIALGWDLLTNPALASNPPQANFDMPGAIKTAGMDDHFDELSMSQSQPEFDARVAKIKQNQLDQEKLSQSPLAGSLMSMGIGIMDPAFLLAPEEAVPMKIGFLAKAALVNPIKWTAIQAAEQAGKNSLDNTNTPFNTVDALRNSVAASLTFGLLGKAAPFINAKGKLALDTMNKNFLANRDTPISQIEPKGIEDMPGSGFGPNTLSAAMVSPEAAAAQRAEVNAQSEQVGNLGKMLPDSITSPGTILLNSDSPAVRNAGAALFENNQSTVGEKAGTGPAKPLAVDTAKRQFEGPLAPFARAQNVFKGETAKITSISPEEAGQLAQEINAHGNNYTPDQITPELVRSYAQRIALQRAQNGTEGPVPAINTIAKKMDDMIQQNYQDHLDQGLLTHNEAGGRVNPDDTQYAKDLQAAKDYHENLLRAQGDYTPEDHSAEISQHQSEITRLNAENESLKTEQESSAPSKLNKLKVAFGANENVPATNGPPEGAITARAMEKTGKTANMISGHDATDATFDLMHEIDPTLDRSLFHAHYIGKTPEVAAHHEGVKQGKTAASKAAYAARIEEIKTQYAKIDNFKWPTSSGENEALSTKATKTPVDNSVAIAKNVSLIEEHNARLMELKAHGSNSAAELLEVNRQIEENTAKIEKLQKKLEDVKTLHDATPVEERDNGKAPSYWSWYMDRDKLNNNPERFVSGLVARLKNMAPEDVADIRQGDMFGTHDLTQHMTDVEARGYAQDIHEVMVKRVNENNLAGDGEDPNGMSGPQLLRKLSQVPGYEGVKADRLLNLLPEDLVRPYMKEGIDETMTHLIHSTAGRLALKKALGYDTYDKYVKNVMYPEHRQNIKDAETLAKTPAEAKAAVDKLNEAYDKANGAGTYDGKTNYVKGVIDNVRGDVPNMDNALLSGIRQLSRVEALGGSPLTFTAGGLITAARVHDVLPVMGHILNWADSAAKNMTREELEQFGIMSEMALHDHIRTAANSAESGVSEADIARQMYTPHTLGEKITAPFANLSRKFIEGFSKWSGSKYMTDGFRSMNAQLAMKRIMSFAGRNWDDLDATDKSFLLKRGIDQGKLEGISAALKSGAPTFKGTGGYDIPQLSKWTDRKSVEAIRTAAMVDAYTSFHSVNSASLSQVFQNHRTLLQFKSFLPSMMNQFVIAGMQESPARFLTAALGMVALQALNVRIREILGGYDPKKDRTGIMHDWFGAKSSQSQAANLATLAEKGFAKSGLLGVPGEGLGMLYDFAKTAIVKNDFPTFLSEQAGPAVGEVGKIAKAGAELYKHRKGKSWNDKDFATATAPLPGQNFWSLRPYELADSLFGTNKYLDNVGSQLSGGNNQVPLAGGPTP